MLLVGKGAKARKTMADYSRNRRVSQIQRRNPNESIGVVIGSGDSGHIVTQIDESGAAYASGVRIGDIITSINDVDVSQVSHKEVVQRIASAGINLELGLMRDGISQIISGQVHGTAKSGSGGDEPLGITLVTGGAFGEKTGVTRVDPNSPGERAGLHVGDIITSVNGVSVVGKSHHEVLQMVKNSSSEELAIGVARGQEQVTATSSSAMILDLGIVVEKTAEGFVQIIEVFVNGAGESGGLHVGDLIIDCDGYSLVKEKFKKSVNILRTVRNSTASLVVCPQPMVRQIVRGYQSRNPTSGSPPQFYTIQLARVSLGAGEVESLGMGLVTEQQGPRGHKVSTVEPGGCADRGGVLEGDKLTHINGQSVIQLQHTQVLDMLKKSGMTFTIGIERSGNLPAPPAESQIDGPRTVMETEHFTEVEI